jgi:hypothetical protein
MRARHVAAFALMYEVAVVLTGVCLYVGLTRYEDRIASPITWEWALAVPAGLVVGAACWLLVRSRITGGMAALIGSLWAILASVIYAALVWQLWGLPLPGPDPATELTLDFAWPWSAIVLVGPWLGILPCAAAAGLILAVWFDPRARIPEEARSSGRAAHRSRRTGSRFES